MICGHTRDSKLRSARVSRVRPGPSCADWNMSTGTGRVTLLASALLSMGRERRSYARRWGGVKSRSKGVGNENTQLLWRCFVEGFTVGR